jgi:predicted DNA-binding transcriptional regulator AlpA
MNQNNPAGDNFLPARAVWERYGVSDMTLWRWLRDPSMAFPQPTYFGRLRFWRIGDLERWERMMRTRSPAAKNPAAEVERVA